MNSYIESNLVKDEKVVSVLDVNPLAIIPTIIIRLILMIVDVVLYFVIPKGEVWLSIFLICLLIVFLMKNTVKAVLKFLDIKGRVVCLTNRRVLGKKGIISRYTIDFPISKIDNVSINTPFWGRIFNYSTVVIHSNSLFGISEYEYALNANQFKNTIMEETEKYKDEERKKQALEYGATMAKAAEQNS